jgi:hypothetical protein
MQNLDDDRRLERLAGTDQAPDAADWQAVAATPPNGAADDQKLASLLERIHRLVGDTPGEAPEAQAVARPEPTDWSPESAFATTEPAAQNVAIAPRAETPSSPDSVEEFLPTEPTDLSATGLAESEVESLILKLLMARGDAAGRSVADHVKLPFGMVAHLLSQLKHDQLLVYRDSAPMNDYIYQLTDIGRERARRLSQHCTYFGAAPVSLKDYVESVKAQSLGGQHPSVDDLRKAFSDLLINTKMLERLGPAINSGRGLFLFGAPGNGKTSIAERVTSAFGEYVWVPRAIGVDGEIMRLFDPLNHETAPIEQSTGLLDATKIDKRWIRIKRPTIVVGGELTMANLEVCQNSVTGISESPLQLKSNCGTLVIDDFGRQRMSTDELLNRWIVPLEKRYDFLNMGNGKKIQVPFDQLIIFSTNLEPKDLVDEAFLRRIPYKIEVIDPTEEDFRKLFEIMCPKMGFEHDQAAIDHLIATHYRAVNRPFRNCQPRDLLLQVQNHCHYQRRKPKLTPESFDFAAENYFAVM